jgi:hypothetical protein
MDQTSKFAGLVLALQAISTAFLWTVNPLGANGDRFFSIFMTVNLLSFAMLSKIYRSEKVHRPLRRMWLLLGSCILIALLLLNIATV